MIVKRVSFANPQSTIPVTTMDVVATAAGRLGRRGYSLLARSGTKRPLLLAERPMRTLLNPSRKSTIFSVEDSTC